MYITVSFHKPFSHMQRSFKRRRNIFFLVFFPILSETHFNYLHTRIFINDCFVIARQVLFICVLFLRRLSLHPPSLLFKTALTTALAARLTGFIAISFRVVVVAEE